MSGHSLGELERYLEEVDEIVDERNIRYAVWDYLRFDMLERVRDGLL